MDTKITEEKIQAVADKIVREFQPEKIILFGSYAWGKPNQDSDVDLLVIKDVEDTRELARKIDGALSPRYFPMDILVYRPDRVIQRQELGDMFLRKVMAIGKTLYAR